MMLSSAAVEVTPSRMFSSAAVEDSNTTNLKFRGSINSTSSQTLLEGLYVTTVGVNSSAVAVALSSATQVIMSSVSRTSFSLSTVSHGEPEAAPSTVSRS